MILYATMFLERYWAPSILFVDANAKMNTCVCVCVSWSVVQVKEKKMILCWQRRSIEEEQAVHLLSLPCIHHRQDTQICVHVCVCVHLMHEKPNQR